MIPTVIKTEKTFYKRDIVTSSQPQYSTLRPLVFLLWLAMLIHLSKFTQRVSGGVCEGSIFDSKGHSLTCQGDLNSSRAENKVQIQT